MNEQEAFNQLADDYDIKSAMLIARGFSGAIEWVKQGQEPLVFAREDQLNKLTRNVNPSGQVLCTLSTENKQGCLVSLYTHPAPQPDVAELVEAARFLLNEVGHLGNASPASLTKLEQALAKWEGKR